MIFHVAGLLNLGVVQVDMDAGVIQFYDIVTIQRDVLSVLAGYGLPPTIIEPASLLQAFIIEYYPQEPSRQI